MHKFIEDLLRAAAKIPASEFFTPDEPVGDDDQVVGVVSDELKGLCTLACNLRLQQAAIEEDYETQVKALPPGSTAHGEIWAKLRDKHHEIVAKASVINRIVDCALRAEFGLWGKRTIAIHENWQVSWSNEEPRPCDLVVSSIIILGGSIASARGGH